MAIEGRSLRDMATATTQAVPVPNEFLRVAGLVKRYGSVTAVDGVSFGVARGEMVTLLGPSGCGKTSTLRCIAGIEPMDEGEISIGGEVVSAPQRRISLPPERRNVGMVFQSYALWPHMTVFGNVAYPLQVRRFPKSEIAPRVQRALELVGLAENAQRNVTQLSGGQQQRVALARALVYDPRVLLLDEPLSNLDARLRESMRLEIRRIQQELGITAVYVTHDQAEAMVISDRVIVMHQGRIEQVGRPLEVYSHPANRFVASFLGVANLVEGTITEVEGQPPVARVQVQLNGRIHEVRAQARPELGPGTRVAVCVRPQDVQLMVEASERVSESALVGAVSRVVQMGSHVEYHVEVGGAALVCHSSRDLCLGPGTRVSVRFAPTAAVCVSL